MPIRVRCPNGCLLRMPADRAGKIVRCPGCKAIIALPTVTGDSAALDASTQFLAKLVNPSTVKGSPAATNSSAPTKVATPPTLAEDLATPVSSNLVPTSNAESIAEPMNATAATPDEILSPIKPSQEAPEIRLQRQQPSTHHSTNVSQTGQGMSVRKALSEDEPTLLPKIRIAPEPAVETPQLNESGLWKKRFHDANQARIALARAVALLMIGVGLVNAGPAIFVWYQSWSAVNQSALPRWIYFQIFVAALHVIYALFIFQIADWSSLKAVSVVMLVFAFGYGLISTALLLDKGQGWVSQFFALPQLLAGKATLWSGCMLCLATLMAYICGKEANDWCRSEQLLVEIFKK